MRKQKLWVFIGLVTLVLGVWIFLSDGPRVALHNYQLKQSMNAIEDDVVNLNDLVPFKWDRVYSLEPYTSKQDIEALIGIKSSAISGNQVSEGMVHLVFIHGNKVVASILAYPKSLGFQMNFEGLITYSDQARFSVVENESILTLSLLGRQR